MVRRKQNPLGPLSPQVSSAPPNRTVIEGVQQAKPQQFSADFAKLSSTLQAGLDEFKEFSDSAFQAVAKTVGEGRGAGKTDAQIFKELSESGKTPEGILRQIKKQFDSSGFNALTNPAFRLTLSEEEGRAAAFRELEKLDSIKDDVAAQLARVDSAEDQEEFLRMQMLGAQETARGDSFDAINVFGRAAAQPILAEGYARFRSEVRAIASDKRKEIAQELTQANFADDLRGYANETNDKSRVLRMKVLTKTAVRLDAAGHEDVYQGLANAALAEASRVFQESDGDYEETRDFLEEVLENMVDSTGSSIFNKDFKALSRINNEMDRLVARTKSEGVTESERRRNNTMRAAYESEAKQGYITAASQGTDALVSFHEREQRTLQRVINAGTDEEVADMAARYNVSTRKDLRLMFEWNDQQLKSQLSPAEQYDKAQMRLYAGELFEVGQTDPAAAEARLNQMLRVANPEDIVPLFNMWRSINTPAGRNNVERVLAGTNLESIATSHLFLNDDEERDRFDNNELFTTIQRMRATAAQWLSEHPNMRDQTTLDADTEAKLSLQLADVLSKEFRPRSDTPIGSAETGGELTDAQKSVEAREKSRTEPFFANNNKMSLLGGQLRIDAPDSLLRLDAATTNAKPFRAEAVPGWTGLSKNAVWNKYSWKLVDPMSRLVADEDLTDTQKADIAREALAAYGVLDTKVLLGETPVEGHLAKTLHPSVYEEDGLSAAGVDALVFMNSLDYRALRQDFNVFNTRLTDFKDAKDLLVQGTQGLMIKPNPPQERIQRVREVLEHFDMPTDVDFVKRFIIAQYNNWSTE